MSHSQKPPSQLQSIGLLLISMTSVTAGATCAKKIFPVLGATGVASLRICFGAVILMAIWRPWRQKISRDAFKLVGAVASCGSSYSSSRGMALPLDA